VYVPDERAWSDYARNSLMPLYRSARGILGYVEFLRRELEGKYVVDAANGLLGGAVVGGMRAPGDEHGASSHRLHSLILGLDYDVASFVSDLRSGMVPRQRVAFRWTPFTGFVSSVADVLDRCVFPGYPGAIEPPAIEPPKSPDEFMAALAGFFESYLNLSPAHNPVTFFIWSLRKNSADLVREVYPDLGALARALGLVDALWAPGVRVVGYPEYGSTLLYNAFGPSNYHGLLRRFLDAGACRSPGGAMSLLVDSLWLYAEYSPELRALGDYLEGLENPAAAYMGLVKGLAPSAPCESGELRGSVVHLGGAGVGLAELLRGPAGILQFYGLREYFIFRGPHGTRILCLDREVMAR